MNNETETLTALVRELVGALSDAASDRAEMLLALKDLNPSMWGGQERNSYGDLIKRASAAVYPPVEAEADYSDIFGA